MSGVTWHFVLGISEIPHFNCGSLYVMQQQQMLKKMRAYLLIVLLTFLTDSFSKGKVIIKALFVFGVISLMLHTVIRRVNKLNCTYCKMIMNYELL